MTLGRRKIPGELLWLDGCVCSRALSEEVVRPLSALGGSTARACVGAALAGENTLSAREGTILPRVTGYGVLKDGALAGWLDLPAARGTTILLNKSGEISYALPEGSGAATLTLRRCRAELRPLRDGEELFFRVEIDARAALTGLSGAGGLTQSRLVRLEEALGAVLKEETELVWPGRRIWRRIFWAFGGRRRESFPEEPATGRRF